MRRKFFSFLSNLLSFIIHWKNCIIKYGTLGFGSTHHAILRYTILSLQILISALGPSMWHRTIVAQKKTLQNWLNFDDSKISRKILNEWLSLNVSWKSNHNFCNFNRDYWKSFYYNKIGCHPTTTQYTSIGHSFW